MRRYEKAALMGDGEALLRVALALCANGPDSPEWRAFAQKALGAQCQGRVQHNVGLLCAGSLGAWQPDMARARE